MRILALYARLMASGCKGVNDAALERVVRLSGPTLEWVDVRGVARQPQVGGML